MIELNLLPKELRKKKAKKQLPHIRIVPIAIAAAGAVVALYLVIAVFCVTNSLALKDLKAKLKEIQPQKEATERIATLTAELDKRVTSIRKIAKPRIAWARMMSGLNQAVIQGIWLYEFRTMAGKGAQLDVNDASSLRYLELSGYALGESERATALVAKFINSLKDSKDFSVYFEDIELQVIDSREVSGEKAMLFKLLCSFKPDAPPAGQGAPAPGTTGRKKPKK